MKVVGTNRDLRGHYSALQILGNRFLPTIASDLKIGQAPALVAKVAEPMQASRNKVPIRLMEELGFGISEFDKLSSFAQQMFVAKLNDAYTEFDNVAVTFEYPDRLVINQNDLPKERAGEKGWENGSTIGAIVADLGVLFEQPKEGG